VVYGVEGIELNQRIFADIILKQSKMPIEILTKQDLNEFKSELLNELKSLLGKSKSATPQKEWLKSHEVRKLLGISPGTLQTMRVNEVITYSKVGGIFFHSYADICKLLDGKNK
jgi:hypothetical protein